MSKAQDHLADVSIGAKYHAPLTELGLAVEVVTEFSDVPHLAKMAGRTFQMPGFDVVRNDHTERSAFWLFLMRGDVPIGCCAAILQDLGAEPLGRYLRRVSDNHFPNENGSTIQSVAQCLDPKVTGRVVYIGELTIGPQDRGNPAIFTNFMRLLMALSLWEWDDLDWVYAFMPDRHVRANLDLRYGFTQRIPRAQIWRQPEPEKRASSEWWVGATKEELLHMLLHG